MIAPLCCAVSLFLKITVQAGTSFKISSCINCFYIINVSLSLKLDGKIYVNLVSSLCFWLTEHKFTMGALFIILFMNRVYPHLEELNKTHKGLRLRIKRTKQDLSDDRSCLSALSYLLAPELADSCNCPDSRCFRLMNTKDNAIIVRITPRT